MDKQQRLDSIRQSIEAYVQECFDFDFDRQRPLVRLHEPTYGAEEIWQALECLLTTRVTMGPKVKGFEKAFAERFGFPHAVMVNSGSSANLLAVAAVANPAAADRLEPGDEVIVSALSWSTTIWPLVQHQLVPVIVDIDPATLDIDPNEAERALSDKTRAVMPVHVYGNPCDMGALMDLARRRSLTVIEDCCEAMGASYQGRSVGSFGRVGTFSTYFSHHITTLEGGLCASADHELAELMRTLRAHGWVRENVDPAKHLAANPDIDPKFLFVNMGYNLRATELQGGFGPPQLRKLQSFIDVRSSNAAFWAKELDRFRDVFDWQQPTPGAVHSWFGFPMTVRAGAPFTVGELRRFLGSRDIETRPIIAGNIAIQPAMAYFPHRVAGDLCHSNHVMKNGFTFGNHQAVGDAARRYILKAIQDFLASKGVA